MTTGTDQTAPTSSATTTTTQADSESADGSTSRRPQARLAALLAAWSTRLAEQPGRGKDSARSAGVARRWRGLLLGALAVVMIIIAAVVLGGGTDGSSSDETSAIAGAEPAAVSPAFDGADGIPESASDAGAADLARSALPDGSTSSSELGIAPGPEEPTGSQPARPDGVEPRIIRTGTSTVEVRPGTVEEAVATLSAAAAGLDGYVESSEISGTASTSDDARQSATVTLRVPSESFDELRSGVADVGTVRSASMSSQDVTGEYVDLEARKRALVASRNTYLTLLSKAETVGETLSVQQAIDNVQIQIEQIEGQLMVLTDATDLATLTVLISEEGAPVTRADGDRSGLSEALHRSWDRFIGGIEEIVALIGPLALVALLAGLAYGGYRLVRGLRRRAAASGSPEPAE